MNFNVNAAVLALGIAIGAAGGSWAQAAQTPPAKPAADDYLYKRVVEPRKEKVEQQLNELALQGWELVAANELPGPNNGTILYLRRP